MTGRRPTWVTLIGGLALLLAACGGGEESSATTTLPPTTAEPSPPATPGTEAVDNTEAVEVTEPTVVAVSFSSNGFALAGDLHLPGGPGPHGAVILVHSSGAQDRFSTPSSSLVGRKFVDAGYAVLTWDKPGSGDSTGEFSEEHRTTELAAILVDGIGVLLERPDIDPDRIGFWGLSQAGWVMPRALQMTDDVDFMIVVSGGGEDGIEQMVYQWEQRAACGGATADEVELIAQYGPQALKATEYEEYREAMELVLEIPDLSRYVGVQIELQSEDDWQPWPRDIDAFFDPMTVIENTTIPVLAIFGKHDIQVDPVQGAEAYRTALAQAGNTASHVEVIPGADHILKITENRCHPGTGGYADRYIELIDEWIARLGEQ